MIKRVIKKLKDKNILHTILRYNQELEWANIYHDSIRGKTWLTDLPINVGRMAGNYSFFYILNRILNDCKPKEILEFGLGESSKVISTYIDHYLTESNHYIIEQDNEWLTNFNSRFTLSSKSSVLILPLIKRRVKGRTTYGYENIGNHITKKYDLYLVDGPSGSPHYSRYDIVDITKNMNQNDEFIILMDDCQKVGEQQTFNSLLENLKANNIEVFTATYAGTKAVSIIATSKYKFISSL